MGESNEKLDLIVARAETEVLGIVAEAASAGDYRLLDTARDLAGRLLGLRKSLAADSKTQVEHAEPASRKTSTLRKKSPRKISGKRTAKGKKADYPKYRIKDGCLYKVAWSKKKKSEYTHRLPLSKVSRLFDLLERHHVHGEPMITEVCLQAVVNQDDALPAYQFYIVLGLLKQLQAAHAVGRESFSLDVNWRSDAERFIRNYDKSGDRVSK